LAKALEACRRHKARLVIAKLDRLSRNLAFIATLMEAGVEFLSTDYEYSEINVFGAARLSRCSSGLGPNYPNYDHRPYE
jgi:hypothetical protein